MKLNTNLVNLLTSLASAAQEGGINVEINVSVNVSSPDVDSSSSKQSTEGFVPDGDKEPMIGPFQAEEELGEFLTSKSEVQEGASEQQAQESSPDRESEAVPGSQEVESSAVEKEPKSEAKSQRPPRPKKPGVPAAGTNRRCIKMVAMRQKQLSEMGREVPETLMKAPASEAEAKQMLTDLRPYLAS